MIRYVESNIFESRADALVNPVNCDGFMGKGLALEFKKRFPEYFHSYKLMCDAKKLRPGKPVCVRLIIQPKSDWFTTCGDYVPNEGPLEGEITAGVDR